MLMQLVFRSLTDASSLIKLTLLVLQAVLELCDRRLLLFRLSFELVHHVRVFFHGSSRNRKRVLDVTALRAQLQVGLSEWQSAPLSDLIDQFLRSLTIGNDLPIELLG